MIIISSSAKPFPTGLVVEFQFFWAVVLVVSVLCSAQQKVAVDQRIEMVSCINI